MYSCNPSLFPLFNDKGQRCPINALINMKQELAVTVSFQIEVATTKIVKVKSHKRVVNGKTVKVRSHYRRIGDAK